MKTTKTEFIVETYTGRRWIAWAWSVGIESARDAFKWRCTTHIQPRRKSRIIKQTVTTTTKRQVVK